MAVRSDPPEVPAAFQAEWEYAARAGSTSAYSFGDDPAMLDEYAWFYGNSDGKAHAVDDKRKKPNQFSLYDMYGNVWEWVEDCYHENYNEAPKNGLAWTTGDCSQRVIRGGSWVDDPQDLRSAIRNGYSTVLRLYVLGFRVGRTLLPP